MNLGGSAGSAGCAGSAGSANLQHANQRIRSLGCVPYWRKWIRVINVLVMCDECMLLAVLAAANCHVGCI